MSQNNGKGKDNRKKTSGPAQRAYGKGYGRGYQQGQADARKRQGPLSRFFRKFGL